MDFKTTTRKEKVEKKNSPKVDLIIITESQYGNYNNNNNNKKMTWKWYICVETTITSPEDEAGLLIADQRGSWKEMFNSNELKLELLGQ